jgi:hypothetical protein
MTKEHSSTTELITVYSDLADIYTCLSNYYCLLTDYSPRNVSEIETSLTKAYYLMVCITFVSRIEWLTSLEMKSSLKRDTVLLFFGIRETLVQHSNVLPVLSEVESLDKHLTKLKRLTRRYESVLNTLLDS